MAARTTKTGITAAQIKGSDLYGKLIRANGEAADYPDGEILRKLYSAEDFYERSCQFKWQATRVFSSPQIRADAPDPAVRVSDYDPTKDIAESAFEYDALMFRNNQWGEQQLGQRPVQSVQQCFFWYPGAQVGSSWRIPLDWLRLDYRYGTLQIVPASGAQMQLMSLNAYIASSVAGGRGMPASVFIDYTAGFTPDILEAQHQDLLEGVRLRTLLFLFGILSTVRSGGQTGGSLGLDGLSESKSFGGKYGAYAGEIELAKEFEAEVRETWMQAEQGPAVAFA